MSDVTVITKRSLLIMQINSNFVGQALAFKNKRQAILLPLSLVIPTSVKVNKAFYCDIL